MGGGEQIPSLDSAGVALYSITSTSGNCEILSTEAAQSMPKQMWKGLKKTAAKPPDDPQRSGVPRVPARPHTGAYFFGRLMGLRGALPFDHHALLKNQFKMYIFKELFFAL